MVARWSTCTCAEHPAYTVGIATGAIGFGGCAVDEVKIGDCAAIGAITGVFFGALTALLYHYTDSNAHELKMDESLGSGGALELHTFTPPPPVPLDARRRRRVDAHADDRRCGRRSCLAP